MTLVELGQEWLQSDHAQSLTPDSRANYTRTIEKHIMRWIGTARVEYIDAPYVKEWQRDLRTTGVTPDPMARALKYLKMLLNYAVEEGWLHGNPAQVVKPPKMPASDPVTVLSPRQIEEVIECLERPQDRLYVSMMAYAGLRPIEARLMPRKHVQERSLIVRATKTNRVDTIRTWDFLMEQIRAWIDATPGGPSDPVLPALASKTAYDNWRNRIFNKAAVEAGWGEAVTRTTPRRVITDYKATITPYTMRHSYASMLLRAGWPDVNVAAAMRHSLEMTRDEYSHVIQDMDPTELLILPDAILEARKLTTNGHALLV